MAWVVLILCYVPREWPACPGHTLTTIHKLSHRAHLNRAREFTQQQAGQTATSMANSCEVNDLADEHKEHPDIHLQDTQTQGFCKWPVPFHPSSVSAFLISFCSSSLSPGLSRMYFHKGTRWRQVSEPQDILSLIVRIWTCGTTCQGRLWRMKS